MRMKNESVSQELGVSIIQHQELTELENSIHAILTKKKNKPSFRSEKTNELAGVLFIASYPPRECGIATYSQDLIKSLNNKFSNSLSIKVCALEAGDMKYKYPDEVQFILNTSIAGEYGKMALEINNNNHIHIVVIQHEFGLYREHENAFLLFLSQVIKPVVISLHSVLPNPNERLKTTIKNMDAFCTSFIVMTQNSADILINNYDVPPQKISVIAHGTHLVQHLNKHSLKRKYGLKGRKVLSTFGLLSSGKCIETSLKALPAIVKQCPEVIFLIIGKTHPGVVKEEGERYRESLIKKVEEYGLHNHVQFVNSYLSLPDLLEYLQLTDLYLFTSCDPNQAVSGTFAYAMSCACPIISTPIPHAREVLDGNNGLIVDFRNPQQLAESVIRLMNNRPLLKHLSINSLQKMVSTSWENSATAHVKLFENVTEKKIKIHFNLPDINLSHFQKMTTNTGIIQFSKINQPDIGSGYTLDDNARAMIASCMHFKLTGDDNDIVDVRKYLGFLKLCLQPGGNFLNYVDKNLKFSDQNSVENLDDANGRAVWALGYLILLKDILPCDIICVAEPIMKKSLQHIGKVHSTRAMAFALKGIFYYQSAHRSPQNINLIKTFADRLTLMFLNEFDHEWKWFEGYLTYANSILPEAMLYAWLLTGSADYKEIAISSFDFLLSKIFKEDRIEVISNRNWIFRDKKISPPDIGGEQPIDVAYTIIALDKYYEVFQIEKYLKKMEIAFSWFLGNNRINQIVYNPCTGGCYDGLEESTVNLNQGAESTISYLIARFIMEKYRINNSKMNSYFQSPLKTFS
jgi:glycosyltransferase involved in cell wall biosynthesis